LWFGLVWFGLEGGVGEGVKGRGGRPRVYTNTRHARTTGGGMLSPSMGGLSPSACWNAALCGGICVVVWCVCTCVCTRVGVWSEGKKGRKKDISPSSQPPKKEGKTPQATPKNQTPTHMSMRPRDFAHVQTHVYIHTPTPTHAYIHTHIHAHTLHTPAGVEVAERILTGEELPEQDAVGVAVGPLCVVLPAEHLCVCVCGICGVLSVLVG
jgi:hypothetical protein